ncbi:helix-turn-helix domain-containing protein [Flavobacterium psychrophilum]|uniref:helix-turn-helix domain-containing protein n=1 Tax=Flavobacterium psychrophilum TaxID=96345 RepID=UPI000B7C392A|nr:helix-turn-helix transcriptional regulator [Flavobacterium psychrophilum]SNA88300.1 hypothetical protein FI146_840163 [Flavobacterium psychrophilum]
MISYKEKILKFRKMKKLTQTEFAKELEVSRSYIAQIEGGIIEPSPAFLGKIIEKFDVNKKYFFTDDNENINLNLVDENVHLIAHQNVHLFENSDLDSEKLTLILYDYEKKINNLYQRLIDIKLMNNKQENSEIEKDLGNFIDRFAIIRNKYINDRAYNKSGFVLYNDEEYIDFKELDKIKLKEYYSKLQSDLSFFEYVFFEYFRKFYNEYMKDWYNKSKVTNKKKIK